MEPLCRDGIVAPLVAIDATFLSSNALKIPRGGWFPILIGAVVFTLLTTWKRGRAILLERLSRGDDAARRYSSPASRRVRPTRVPGTAVFLTNTPGRVPHALLHNLKHNKVLHEQVVLLTVTTRDIPVVPLSDRVRIDDLGCDFHQFEAFFGFKEDPEVPELLEECGSAVTAST